MKRVFTALARLYPNYSDDGLGNIVMIITNKSHLWSVWVIMAKLICRKRAQVFQTPLVKLLIFLTTTHKQVYVANDGGVTSVTWCVYNEQRELLKGNMFSL